MRMRGVSHYKAKLQDDDVRLIRTLHFDHGLSTRAVAEKFDVSQSTVAHIVNYRKWIHVP